MFKCLYIAGHIWIVQGDTAVNLNLINTIKENDNQTITTTPVRGQSGTRREILRVDAPLYEVLENCELQATEKLMGEQQ